MKRRSPPSDYPSVPLLAVVVPPDDPAPVRVPDPEPTWVQCLRYLRRHCGPKEGLGRVVMESTSGFKITIEPGPGVKV